MSRIRICIATLALAAVLTGCGGGGGGVSKAIPAGKGEIKLVLDWPKPSRMLPANRNYAWAALLKTVGTTTTVVSTQSATPNDPAITFPVGASTEPGLFDPGDYTVVVGVYFLPTGGTAPSAPTVSGVLSNASQTLSKGYLASGDAGIKVYEGEQTDFTVHLASPLSQMKVNVDGEDYFVDESGNVTTSTGATTSISVPAAFKETIKASPVAQRTLPSSTKETWLLDVDKASGTTDTTPDQLGVDEVDAAKVKLTNVKRNSANEISFDTYTVNAGSVVLTYKDGTGTDTTSRRFPVPIKVNTLGAPTASIGSIVGTLAGISAVDKKALISTATADTVYDFSVAQFPILASGITLTTSGLFGSNGRMATVTGTTPTVALANSAVADVTKPDRFATLSPGSPVNLVAPNSNNRMSGTSVAWDVASNAGSIYVLGSDSHLYRYDTGRVRKKVDDLTGISSLLGLSGNSRIAFGSSAVVSGNPVLLISGGSQVRVIASSGAGFDTISSTLEFGKPVVALAADGFLVFALTGDNSVTVETVSGAKVGSTASLPFTATCISIDANARTAYVGGTDVGGKAVISTFKY